ncbi:hypothetical protein CCYA_CCYA01G0095 [Cyanidiococcus yangmingshanensis]|nr:hypothetical protein CCYA_CCYA01G0095 [Cyanidiococcus yangmingshanensis]
MHGNQPFLSVSGSESMLYRLQPESFQSLVRFAARLLRVGEIVALPTDTVYGLAAAARNEHGVELLYETKQRDLRKPLAIAVPRVSDVAVYMHTEHLPPGLLESFLPGPVTVVLRQREEYMGIDLEDVRIDQYRGWERAKRLATNLNLRGDGLLGVRVPDAEFACAVSRELGDPLALTSANVSGRGECGSVDEFRALWDSCAAVFDGGAIPQPVVPSTVVDLSTPGAFRITRTGWIADDLVHLLENKFGLHNESSSDASARN